MSIIKLLRKLIAALIRAERSVDSILDQHQKTIEALNARSAAMADRGGEIEEEIAKHQAKLNEILRERNRADAVAASMRKVFHADIVDEVAL